MSNQDRIKQRAYEIWEREGRPEGHESKHWSRAEQELQAQLGDDDHASGKPAEPELEQTIAPAESTAPAPKKRTRKPKAERPPA